MIIQHALQGILIKYIEPCYTNLQIQFVFFFKKKMDKINLRDHSI